MYGKKIIKSIMLTVLIAAACISTGCEHEQSSLEKYKELLSVPMQNLMNQGKAYSNAGRIDSAYTMYATVAGRYNPSLAKNDKGLCQMACNNAAYIAHFYYNDYPLACAYLTKSLEIADEIHANGAYPYIYINFGNLMFACGNWDEGMNYHIKAIDMAIQNKDTANYLKGAANLFAEALLKDKVAEYRHTVYEFPVLQSSGPLWNYTYKLYKVARARLKGDYADMECTLRSMSSEDDNGIVPRDRLIFFRKFLLAKSEEFQGHTRRAIDLLKGIESMRQRTPELNSYLYNALYVNYRRLGISDSSADYRLRYAELADTLRSDQKIDAIYDMKRMYENRSINIRMENLLLERETHMHAIWTVSGFSILILVLLVWLIISRHKITQANRLIYARNQELLQELDAHRTITKKSRHTRLDAEGRTERLDVGHNADQTEDETLQRIKAIMETSPEIYMPDFSVERLAYLLELPVRKVSKTINDGTGWNFSTMLQTYRIREACRRLSEKNGVMSKHTIEAIAAGLGFKSRSNFNTVFKKHTGLTPAAWQKIALSEQDTDR